MTEPPRHSFDEPAGDVLARIIQRSVQPEHLDAAMKAIQDHGDAIWT